MDRKLALLELCIFQVKPEPSRAEWPRSPATETFGGFLTASNAVRKRSIAGSIRNSPSSSVSIAQHNSMRSSFGNLATMSSAGNNEAAIGGSGNSENPILRPGSPLQGGLPASRHSTIFTSPRGDMLERSLQRYVPKRCNSLRIR